MRILITGGAGFIGSHAAEYYAKRGHDIVVLDNLSRLKSLKKKGKRAAKANWWYLQRYKNIKLIKEDIRESKKVNELSKNADVIIHAAAQTAVTTSVIDPEEDFSVNVEGTFNILEGARISSKKPTIIFCSTNKVYGGNVNEIKVTENKTRYHFPLEFQSGISESFDIDQCEHTPYGCSKLAGDIYAQDYGHLYGLKIGIFRMSCIYGTRQFGVEDQGWVAWFIIATLLGRPITIYGDGKQVRDVLYISDLIDAYDKFIKSDLKVGVFNIGGGNEMTLSLIELIHMIKEETGKKSKIEYKDWRPGDQKVYISNIEKLHQKLGWSPKVSPKEGVKALIKWVNQNRDLLDYEI